MTMTNQELYNAAIELWRKREMDFPPRVRRMSPDAIDMASGAWHLVLAAAALKIEAENGRLREAIHNMAEDPEGLTINQAKIAKAALGIGSATETALEPHDK
jgi:hypothetical protein